MSNRSESNDVSCWPGIPPFAAEPHTECDPLPASFPDPGSVRDARDLLFRARVGPYQLGTLLGEGGMGQVFLATQETPIRRDVALKVIKRGMDTDAIVRRFASERKALALMDHPSIARVLDAGTTPDGRPFVAMELVQGGRLADYCDGRRLDVVSRVRLFLDVLRGVQHAHQKGVLHRDLKPSNILVTSVDGRPQPKIIDFGIAKALADDEPLATQVTMDGQFIGTPEYMSPEQAGAVGGGVDTRSDIYSLGVVLYELLTGYRPYDFQRRTPTAVSSQLTERRAPVRPSAAIQTRTLTREAGATAMDRASARASSPARLRRTLRGDLDTIVLKAMHPEPDRRYGSAEQFASDLERYLSGQPVLARPDSVTYRTQRFVQRHAFGVAVSVGAVVVASAFVGVLARERNRAIEAEALARIEAQTATQVSAFLVGLFDVATPETGRGRDVTAAEMVDRGAERIRTELADAPAVRGQLLFTLGSVYRALGRVEQAEPLVRESLEVRRSHFGSDHPLVAESLGRLARIRLERGELEQSLQLYRDALAIYTDVHGAESAQAGEVLNNVGLVHLTAGRYQEAIDTLKQAVAIRTASGGDAARRSGSVLYNVAVAHYELGQYEDARDVLDQAEPLLRAEHGVGDGPHPRLVSVASFRGLILRELKEFDAARGVLEAGVADARALYSKPHPALATILNNLALVVQQQGDLDRAEALYREILAIDVAVQGERHADVAHDIYNLASFLYRHRGKQAEGIRGMETALELRTALLGADHPLTAKAMRMLASYRVDAGRLRDGLRLLEAAEAVEARALPAEHPSLAETRRDLEEVRARLR